MGQTDRLIMGQWADTRLTIVAQQLKRIPRYIAHLIKWLWVTQPLIALCAVMAITIVVAVISSDCLERAIRLSGMALQLAGVIIAAIGLRDTRRAFEDQPTTWEGIKQWWAGRPRFTPPTRIISMAALESGDSFMSGRGRVGASPTPSLTDRVALLEQQYGQLFDEVGNLGSELKKQVDELTRAIEVERSERSAGDESNKQRMIKALAEGLPLGRVGVGFFLIGIAAATASIEIASLFGQAACPPLTSPFAS
jgi:hypothetical protein